MKLSRRLISIAALSCALIPFNVGAATLNLSDPCSGTNVVTTCSEAALRAAVLQGGQIGLCCNGTITLSSTIEITRDVVLDASGHSVVISGNQTVRLFTVAPGISFTAVNLTLADGWHKGANASESNNAGLGQGGAIYSSGGIVQLSSCVVSNNQVQGGTATLRFFPPSGGMIPTPAGDGQGGAIFLTNGGIIAVEGSTFVNNIARGGEGVAFMSGVDPANGASAFGGSLYCAEGTVQIQNSLFTNNACITPEGSGNQRTQGGGCYFRDATCVVQNTTISANKTQGTDSTTTGAAGVASAGGGIYATGGSVTLSRVKIANNQALGGRGNRHTPSGQGEGGGIYSTGELVVRESQFTANQTVAGNSGSQPRDGMGGGLYNAGSATLTDCAFDVNLARGGDAGTVSGFSYASRHGFGGGIFNRGSLTLTNCTVALNVAQGGDGFSSAYGPVEPGYSVGGGLFNTNGAVTLQNVTIASNSVAATGGLAVGGNVANTNGTITSRGSILAYSGSGGNAYGPLTDGGFNISSDASCNFGSSSLNASDPLLESLADNGGPTWTMALGADSPAIDFSNDPGAPATDQRGVARPSGLRTDAGAFEFTTQGPLLLISVTGTGVQVSFNAQADTRYQLQSSTDLAQWTTEETLGQYSTTTPCVRQFSLSAGQVRFFRLRIE